MATRTSQKGARADAKRWLMVALAAFALVVSLRVIQDPDYFTHLALGRAFVQAGTPDIAEPFLLQPAGEAPARLAGSGQLGPAGWPFQIALYGLRSAAGDEGVSVAVALLAAMVGILLLAQLPRGHAPGALLAVGAVLVAGTILVARFRFTPRAELPCFALLAAGLHSAGRWRGGGRATWLLGAVAAVAGWSALHPSWIMGAVALGALIVTGRSVGWWRQLFAARRWLLAAAIVVGALAFWGALRFAVSVIGQLRGGVFFAVTEMRPTWEFPELRTAYLALAAAALAAGWGASGGRWGRLAVWGFAFAVGLVVVRNVAFAALLMAAPALEGLASATWWPREGKVDRAAPWVAGVAMLALGAAAVRDRDPPWGIGVDWPTFPRDAAAFVKERALQEPVFNSWDLGGYLDFAWGGTPRTFLDGRLGGAAVDDHDALTEATDPERVLRTRGFQTLVVKPLYDDSGGLVPIVPRLLADPGWSLVRATDALVFVRAPIAPGLEPLDASAGWLAVASLAAHYVATNPGAAAAPYVRAIALASAGSAAEAELAWRDAVRLHPELERRFRRR